MSPSITFRRARVSDRQSIIHPRTLSMPIAQLRKQISIFLPLPEWRALRSEAAREGVPITELCRRWLAPHLATLTRRPDRDA